MARMPDVFAAAPWVALGGAIGGPARFWLSGLVGRRFGETFPWGTFVVNVSGAFALGLLSATLLRAGAGPAWQFGVTGVLGSYTTVSSFSLQTLALAREGQTRVAALHAAGSVAACLSAVLFGAWLGGVRS
jgi:CrcB protein